MGQLNAIILNYVKTSSIEELLLKTAIISKEVEKEKTDKKVQDSNVRRAKVIFY